VDFAEFSRINRVFDFYTRVGVEDIPQHEHASVRNAVVVIA
jgi:hypothetical protein